jgi:hypothetical protein
MVKLSTRIAVAAAIVAGSATVASAQGYDPNGANRFQRLAAAESAGFYLGELQGPLSTEILSEMATSPVGLYGGGPVGAYGGGAIAPYLASPTARQYIGARTAYGPRAGMISGQVSAPAPGYVTPQY